MKNISQILVVLLIVSYSSQKCKFTQTCSVGANEEKCWPTPVVAPNDEAKINENPILAQLCPDLVGKPVCCSDFQLTDLLNKFGLLDQALGSSGTGCSICASNLKRFYCHFACDQTQASWVTRAEVIPEYKPSDIKHPILDIDMHVDYKMVCNIFGSCSSVNFISALGASSSTQGFFNLQSSQGVTEGNVMIRFQYDYTPNPAIKTFEIPVYGCDSDFTASCSGKNKGKPCVDGAGYTLFQAGKCDC